MAWHQTGEKTLFGPMMAYFTNSYKRHSAWMSWMICPRQSFISSGNHWAVHAEQHDDVINWKHFPLYWPFVRGIHWSPVNSPHKGQWRGALMFSLICVWVNGWVNNREAGDLRRYCAHYDVTLKLHVVLHKLRSNFATVVSCCKNRSNLNELLKGWTYSNLIHHKFTT